MAASFTSSSASDFATCDTTLLWTGRQIPAISESAWAYDGSKIAYASTRRGGNDIDLWVMNPSDPKSDHLLLKCDGGGWAPLDWSPDGSQILAINEISAEESYLWLVDAHTGEKKLMTPKGNTNIHYSGAQFSKDGNGVYVTTNKDAEFHRLAYIDIASAQHTILSANIPWDVDGFDLSSDGKRLAFVSNEDGYGVLHVLDTNTRAEIPLPALPRGIIAGVKWHKNNRDLAFDLVSARSNSDVYSLDVQSGQLDRWTESETGGINTSSFPLPELIHWKSWDGRDIGGFLYRPPAKFTGPRPVIINIHGGPEGQLRPGFLGRWNYFLNELGIAMIFPNVRGSSGYGKTFLSLDDGFLREGSYQDINTLLDWDPHPTRSGSSPRHGNRRQLWRLHDAGGRDQLQRPHPLLDRRRRPFQPRYVPRAHLRLSPGFAPQGIRRRARSQNAGISREDCPLQQREEYHQTAICRRRKKRSAPSPASESEQMVSIVRKNGTPVWWLLGNDEGHGFSKKKNVDYQFYATVAFVKQYVDRQR